MNIANALKVHGWMNPEDLEWLAQKARTHTRIVEVGCWRGRSTTALADNTPGTVYAVDHWEGSEEHQPVDAPKLYQMFLDQMAPYIESGKVKVYKGNSTEIADKFAAEQMVFDMVFIDASHDEQSVRADLQAWAPLCKGLFCGHDVGHPPVYTTLGSVLPYYRREGCMWVVDL